MTKFPHASWAPVYDLAYTRSFGEFYNKLTDQTVKLVQKRISTSAKIVDFGAGTGRLSIPLCKYGYEVVAVEPCREMLYELEQKRQEEMKLRTVCSKMQDFKENNFDLALCVFTVLLYLLDEESLKKALSVAHGALKPNGMLLLDIPSRAIFRSYSTEDDLLERFVSVTQDNGDIYRYQEKLKVKCPDGNESIYSDEFRIRYWPSDYVHNLLVKIGFSLEADLSDHFSGTGSYYWIMKKIEQSAAFDIDSAVPVGFGADSNSHS